MPIFYWNKIHETGNLSFLVVTKSVSIYKKAPGRLQEIYLRKRWRELLDEYISRFGFSENVLAIDAKEVEIGRMKVDRLVNNDKSLNAFIKIAEEELAGLKSESRAGSGDFYTLKACVELEWGHLDQMTTTVSEFYSYIEILKARNKKSEMNAINI